MPYRLRVKRSKLQRTFQTVGGKPFKSKKEAREWGKRSKKRGTIVAYRVVYRKK